MDEKELELFNKGLSKIQVDVTDRAFSLAEDFGMDRDIAFFIILSGLGNMH